MCVYTGWRHHPTDYVSVQVGDIILRLNDINLAEMSYESAVEVLKAVPTDAPVVLLLRGPEGYTTHLETTFLENGLPKTIRVTKPVQESIMGRIRRTFSSNGSPSPVKTLKKICKGDDDGSTSPGKKGGKANGAATNINGGESLVELIEEEAVCVESGVTGSADSGYASSCVTVINGDGVLDSNGTTTGSAAAAGMTLSSETVLDNGARGSPKIVLTSPRTTNNGPGLQQSGEAPPNGPTASSTCRRAIEIVQDNDEITVVVKGDVRIHSEVDKNAPGTPTRFIISSNKPHPAAPASVAEKSPEKSGRLQRAELSSPENHADTSDVSDSEEKGLGTPRKSSHNGQRRSSDRRGSTASPKKFAKLRNLLDEKTSVDVLHQKINEVCTRSLSFSVDNLRHIVHDISLRSLSFSVDNLHQKINEVCTRSLSLSVDNL